MATFTSTLPDDLLQQLKEKAQLLKLPKNKLMEKALRIYLNQITRAEYKQSYQAMANDAAMLQMAEEGMTEYVKQIDLEDAKG